MAKIYRIGFRVTADEQLSHLWDSSPMVTLDEYEKLRELLTEALDGFNHSLDESVPEGSTPLAERIRAALEQQG